MAFLSRNNKKRGLSCAACGTMLEPDANFCLNCGSPVGQTAPAADAVPDLPPDLPPEFPPELPADSPVDLWAETPAEAPAVSGIFCAACGTALEEGERFCYACGAPVESASADKAAFSEPQPVHQPEFRPVPQPAPQPEPAPVPQPEPAPRPMPQRQPQHLRRPSPDSIKICPKCFKLMGENDNVCTACGTPLAQSAPAATPAPICRPAPVDRPVPAPKPVSRPAPSARFNSSDAMGGPAHVMQPLEELLPDGSYKLRFITTPERGEVLLSSGDWIGRHSTCALVLEDECVSRNHCRFNYVNGSWLMDLSGTNGLKINGVLYRNDIISAIMVPNHSRLEFSGKDGNNIILEFICNP